MRSLIPSREIVACLARRGPVHHCERCGERMYVRQKSGLCPLCWNARNPAAAASDALPVAQPVSEADYDAKLALGLDVIPDELSLEGILDEGIEGGF